MSDLISRQAAIDEIDEWIKAFRENGHKESAADACLIQDGIIQLPSAEPEIIRCKDCKHYVIHTLFGHRQGWCERLCDEYDKSLARGTEEDDFCSRAEERRR